MSVTSSGAAAGRMRSARTSSVNVIADRPLSVASAALVNTTFRIDRSPAVWRAPRDTRARACAAARRRTVERESAPALTLNAFVRILHLPRDLPRDRLGV